MPGEQQQQQRQLKKLGPFAGAEARAFDDRNIGHYLSLALGSGATSYAAGSAMRGGYNVDLIDGEWWSREGETRIEPSVCSMPWDVIISNPVTAREVVLVNQYTMARMSILTGAGIGSTQPAYSPVATPNITFNQNSANAVSSSGLTAGQIIFMGAAGYGAFMFRVVSASGLQLVLDRPFPGATQTIACRVCNPFTNAVLPTVDTLGQTSAVLFEQRVTWGGSSLGWANPAVTSGHIYIVMCSETASGSQLIPVAVDLSTLAAPLYDFFRDTTQTVPPSVGGHKTFCTVWQGRLIIGPAQNQNGISQDRSFWYSQIGDMMNWASGIQGVTSQSNDVTLSGLGNKITQVATFGLNLVIYRSKSIVVLSPTGQDIPPFTANEITNCLSIPDDSWSRSLIAAIGYHWFACDSGIAKFDGQSPPQVISDSIRRAWSFPALSDSAYAQPLLGLHDQPKRRLVWIGTTSATRPFGASNPATLTLTTDNDSYPNQVGALIYDYSIDSWWFRDMPCTGGTGQTQARPGSVGLDYPLGTPILSHGDGTIVLFDAQEGEVYDFSADQAPSTAVLDCLVDTEWRDFGAQFQKTIYKVELELRSAPVDLVTAVTQNYIEAQVVLGLDIFTDRDLSAPRATQDLVIDYSIMSTLPQDSAGLPGKFRVVCDFTPFVGEVFKFRFRNQPSAASLAAGFLKCPFRISEVIVHLDVNESVRREKAT